MKTQSNKPRFTINMTTDPPTCLPTDIDHEDLIDCTMIGDKWKRFASRSIPGKYYVGDEYAKMAFQASIKA